MMIIIMPVMAFMNNRDLSNHKDFHPFWSVNRIKSRNCSVFILLNNQINNQIWNWIQKEFNILFYEICKSIFMYILQNVSTFLGVVF